MAEFKSTRNFIERVTNEMRAFEIIAPNDQDSDSRTRIMQT
jgi:hypothetical protein